MKSRDIVAKLKAKISSQLTPFIDANYWLMEIPHYDNVGDTLIWQGEMDFLHTLPFNCKRMRALDSQTQWKIEEKDLILFQGGGNFGDLWSKHHDFKMKIMKEHPNNRFIFFPQTVFFEKKENLERCASFMADFNAVICARDNVSYGVLKENFKNQILLVPDMAFYMNMPRWTRRPFCMKKPLLLKRQDKELKDTEFLREIQSIPNIDISDWTPMVGKSYYDRLIRRMTAKMHRTGRLYDVYMYYIYRPYLIRSGVAQILSHTDIYTTRLHACILSILLNKDRISFLDNSYGKNRSFYDTWLKDCESVKMLR